MAAIIPDKYRFVCVCDIGYYHIADCTKCPNGDTTNAMGKTMIVSYLCAENTYMPVGSAESSLWMIAEP